MVSRLMGCRHRTATSPSRLFAGRESGGGFIRSGAGPSGAAAVLLPLSWVKGSNVAVSPQINWEPLLNGGKEDGEWTPAFGVHWTGAVAAGNEWLLPPRPYATCGASRHNPVPPAVLGASARSIRACSPAKVEKCQLAGYGSKRKRCPDGNG